MPAAQTLDAPRTSPAAATWPHPFAPRSAPVAGRQRSRDTALAPCRGRYPEAVASPPQPLGHEDLDQLEPEQRLVAGVIRQALKDAQDPRGNELERTRAQAFLQGGGNFILLCQVGRLEPARVARLAARAQGCQFG